MMKKTVKAFVIVVVCMLAFVSGTAKAQIFLQESDMGENPRVDVEDIGLIIGYQGGDHDQQEYVPLGDGMLLLAGFGAAYLIGNRKRKE